MRWNSKKKKKLSHKAFNRKISEVIDELKKTKVK